MWYPGRDDCPDLTEPTETNIYKSTYAVGGYFYPAMEKSNCQFGRNYPQWYAQRGYTKDYLYITPDECCAKWYPNAGSSCPLGPDDGVQKGFYWLSDPYFFPSYDSKWCEFGQDYPLWYVDPWYAGTHLFNTAEECCARWYPSESLECELNIGKGPRGVWYPTLSWPYDCVDDGNTPSWMMQPGYEKYYIFLSKSACCKSHYCSTVNSLFERFRKR